MGLQKKLVDRLSVVRIDNLSHVTLGINLHGSQLHHSSAKQVWSILAGIIDVTDNEPFVVGCFWGDSKPRDAGSFMKEAVTELKSLLSEGLYMPGLEENIPVTLMHIVCDTPARSFFKQVKGHSGYFGCDKCIQHGIRVDHTMTFPDLRAPLRGDA